MSNFYTRLQLEERELTYKLESLDFFMRTSNFLDISDVQQKLLQIQVVIMKAYLEVLRQRIQNLNQ